MEDITLLTELWFPIRSRGYKHLAPNGTKLARNGAMGRLLSILERVVKFGMPARERQADAIDEQIAHVRTHFE